MPGGGTITFRTRNGPDGEVTVTLEDTGEGMTAEVLQRATEPFYTTKAAGKGTGIGLAMVYGTVQAHHGAMTLDSKVGSGTRVELTFPGSARRPDSPAPVERGPEAAKLRVLVVDDDDMLRESVCEVLAFQGHEAEAAGGGQEALDALARGGSYDLIVLDLNMPGMSGAEALPRILELRPGQRILVASGFTDGAAKGLLDGRPSVRTISKPFTSQELALKLRAW
jgi:CheY-like chemotaxis protein